MIARRLLTFGAALSCLAAPAASAATHVFTWRHQADFGALAACAQKMRPLLDARHDAVHVYEGSELDRFPDQTVILAFNGAGDAEGEPFVFPGYSAPGESAQVIPTRNAVNTAGKPYDEVVTACLIVARECFGPRQLEIASDAPWEEWAKGAALVRRVLGHRAVNPLSGERARAPVGDPASDMGVTSPAPAAPAPGSDDDDGREPETVAKGRNPTGGTILPERLGRLLRFSALLFLAALYGYDKLKRRGQGAGTPPVG